ncbi:hypothetical protein F5984_02410 [Rudanella paleaurantiibacter]|uniref:GLPGLI family protein n=1 Tax=Rudanella paleaurantiibacter TaxID=2614655 RepID=A0A7J5U550_9BACT|nr:hypothetical protein [Rudanella paleaurantiibacter]KAB7732823.1 hypothetical protein F5984_02410 [Rudanella paleaurantiibacter]
MRLLLLSFLLYISSSNLLIAQSKRVSLDSYERVRQNLLLQFIQQLGGPDSLGLRDKDVYYSFYFEKSTRVTDASQAQQEEGRLREIQTFKNVTIGYAQQYCSCQSVLDIKTLPVRYFKRTHPQVYNLVTKPTNMLGLAIDSTLFLIYCPAKNGKKNEVIAAAYFWPNAKICHISGARPETH